MRRLIFAIALIACLLLTTQAQDGHGVIRQGVINNLDSDITSFNPLLCADMACYFTSELLFPTLFAVDHDTQWLTSGTEDNHALADSWTMSEDNSVITIQLRDDVFWSDGTAITAYDYFYSYLALDNGLGRISSTQLDARVEGVVPISTTELVVILKEADCEALPHLNIPIIPSHVFDDSFAETTATFFTDALDNPRSSWVLWDETGNYDASLLLNNSFNSLPSVSGTNFEFVDWDNREHIRLRSGDVAFEMLAVSSFEDWTSRFLMGDLDVVPILPERLADFTSNPNVQIIETQSPLWSYIAINLADPSEPMNFADEDGNLLEQGEHPILGTLAIRQALELGIDKQSLIDIALHGQARVISSLSAPTSWAYDEAVAISEYNPDEAERLLEDAGWVRVAGRAIRECVNCGSAPDGTALRLSLAYSNQSQEGTTAILLQQQLRRIGIELSTYQSNFADMRGQRFDLYLGTWSNDYPASPSLNVLFNPQADVLNSGQNITSYNNPNVTALLENLDAVSQCDLSERQAIHSDIQGILRADLPYIPLYSETASIAVRADIQNVSMTPDDIYWNLEDWVVFNAP
ncbi:MAG: ABC transporter substrate-binding protein [Phototrophicaceae bacterium]